MRNKSLEARGASIAEVLTGANPSGPADSDNPGIAGESSSEESSSADADSESLESYLSRAGLLAAGYDYDGAIAMLSESPYASDEQVTAAIAGYE